MHLRVLRIKDINIFHNTAMKINFNMLEILIDIIYKFKFADN